MNIEFNLNELKAADRLPSPSGTALAIMQLVQQSDATVQQVSQLVKVDPALSGRILRFANSAAFGARRPIADIQTAVMMMGMQTVRNFALSLSLIGSNSKGHCPEFDYEAYWSRSWRCRCPSPRSLPGKSPWYRQNRLRWGCLAT